jgi:hypothetical protein
LNSLLFSSDLRQPTKIKMAPVNVMATDIRVNRMIENWKGNIGEYHGRDISLMLASGLNGLKIKLKIKEIYQICIVKIKVRFFF